MTYAIATGHDAVTLTEIETVMRFPPLADRVPRGSVKRKTLDGATILNGRPVIYWRWRAMSRDDLNTLLNFRGSRGEVTVQTPDINDNFDLYNAYMAEPQPQTDWQRQPGGRGAVVELVVELTLIERLTADLLLEDGGLLLLEDGASLLME